MYAALLATPLLFLIMPLVMARVESRLGDVHAVEPGARRRPPSHRRRSARSMIK
jgi:hypothetical protein